MAKAQRSRLRSPKKEQTINRITMANMGTTILLAEDDIVLQDMYQERLKAEGFTVVLAQDGQQALDKIAESKPQLIILDIMMPRMNGIDVLKKLKEGSDTKDVPVIISTALVTEMEQVKTLLGKNDSYLIKSEVMPGDIIALVKKKLGDAA